MCDDKSDLKEQPSEKLGELQSIRQELKGFREEIRTSSNLALGIAFIALAVGLAGILVADTDAEFHNRVVGGVLTVMFFVAGVYFVSKLNRPKPKSLGESIDKSATEDKAEKLLAELKVVLEENRGLIRENQNLLREVKLASKPNSLELGLALISTGLAFAAAVAIRTEVRDSTSEDLTNWEVWPPIIMVALGWMLMAVWLTDKEWHFPKVKGCSARWFRLVVIGVLGVLLILTWLAYVR